jgi:hypothetical protein
MMMKSDKAQDTVYHLYSCWGRWSLLTAYSAVARWHWTTVQFKSIDRVMYFVRQLRWQQR